MPTLIKLELEEWVIYKGTNKMNMYIVRSLAMTNWLCNNGFKILKVEDSEKDDKLKVFFFEDSPALHNMMMKYRKRVWRVWQKASRIKKRLN